MWRKLFRSYYFVSVAYSVKLHFKRSLSYPFSCYWDNCWCKYIYSFITAKDGFAFKTPESEREIIFKTKFKSNNVYLKLLFEKLYLKFTMLVSFVKLMFLIFLTEMRIVFPFELWFSILTCEIIISYSK